MRMDEETFAEIVQEALESIPEGFRDYLKDIAVDVEDLPNEATCRQMKVRDRRELLGLYHGTPLTERHVEAPYRFPERIVIYQGNIERICRNRRQMVNQIRKTVLHEIGHHFGMDEEDLDDVGYG